jgi:hypothetical protein
MSLIRKHEAHTGLAVGLMEKSYLNSKNALFSRTEENFRKYLNKIHNKFIHSDRSEIKESIIAIIPIL